MGMKNQNIQSRNEKPPNLKKKTEKENCELG